MKENKYGQPIMAPVINYPARGKAPGGNLEESSTRADPGEDPENSISPARGKVAAAENKISHVQSGDDGSRTKKTGTCQHLKLSFSHADCRLIENRKYGSDCPKARGKRMITPWCWRVKL